MRNAAKRFYGGARPERAFGKSPFGLKVMLGAFAFLVVHASSKANPANAPIDAKKAERAAVFWARRVAWEVGQQVPGDQRED